MPVYIIIVGDRRGLRRLLRGVERNGRLLAVAVVAELPPAAAGGLSTGFHARVLRADSLALLALLGQRDS